MQYVARFVRSPKAIRLMIGLTLGLMCITGPAMAHRLVMFAHIEPGTAGPELVIEAKFSSGRLPTQGEVIIKDAEEAVVMQLPLSDTGVTTLPLADLPTASWQEGLAIEVSTSEGHDDYWLLSGDDIRAAFPSPNQSPNLPDTKSEGD